MVATVVEEKLPDGVYPPPSPKFSRLVSLVTGKIMRLSRMTPQFHKVRRALTRARARTCPPPVIYNAEGISDLALREWMRFGTGIAGDIHDPDVQNQLREIYAAQLASERYGVPYTPNYPLPSPSQPSQIPKSSGGLYSLD